MRVFFVSLLLAMVSYANASEVKKLDWSDLPDPNAAVFEDPFRSLKPQQLDALRQIVRLRGQLAESTAADASAAAEASIAKHIGALAAAGIDADALIAQRFTIRDRRRKAASAGNPEIDGQVVELSGFTLPQGRPGAKSILLLSSRVKCSHASMPPANQIIRVLDPQKMLRPDYFVPVRIVGKLRIKPTAKPVRFIDGLRMLPMTFELELQLAEVLGERQASLPSYKPAANFSRVRGRTNRAQTRHE